ncbi:MAG: enoyl-CoA hydratase/isomerase family protein [Archangiaceae bacterium]|nr:enoyl-CoA hydratase/isomerase family protein [Archangiaceae bacterium]
MKSQHITVTREGGVGTLTIDRRERFNSLDVQTARELRQAGLQLARDEQVRCLVVRGSGGIFCSGADLKYIRSGGDKDVAYLTESRGAPAGYGAIFKQILEYLHSTISELRRAPKPVIAAVDGVAAAGGMGLAMCCDLVVASQRATFEYAYFKTGLCGAESSTFFLPKLVGLRRAMDLALLNPRLTAAEAKELGLVSLVLPDADFEPQLLALAQRLADGPTAAYAAAKRLMNEAAGVDRLDFHLDRELEALAHSADSADFAEGLAAFFGKRAPVFGGK